MLERKELLLKIGCWIAGAFLIYRLGLAVMHFNPLYHVKIPALPALAAASTNSAAPNKSTAHASISVANATHTNHPPHSTNLVAKGHDEKSFSSNSVAVTTAKPEMTNQLALQTNPPGTLANRQSNTVKTAQPGLVMSPASNGGRPPQSVPGMMPPGMMTRGPFAGPPGMPGGRPSPGPELPREQQARIDRVIESEILAPVMRPLPMALLGIAGKDAFLRAPNGQTGLVKEGDELGGVKLVRIGINRVLVDQDGEQKELTIFSGLGSESLLTSHKDSSK